MAAFDHNINGLWAGITSVGGLEPNGHASSGVFFYTLTQMY